jgi:Ni,Fe-hydrogenase III small subunit
MEDIMKKSLAVLIFLVIAFTAFATTIYDVQYTTVAGPDGTYPSPMEGQIVTVTGIVNAIDFKGYKDNIYITMPTGGPWEGIYVYACGDTNVVVGDEVEITATVSEYYGLTELTDVTDFSVLSSGNPVPDPMVVQTADLVDAADAEPYEGCLVELNDVVVTSEQTNYGEWYVADASAVPCQMDDGFFYLDSITPPIVITVGMTWHILRGMVSYSYDEYEVNPRTPDDMIEVASSPNNVVPTGIEFVGCYPNPFNPQTTAFLNLSTDTHITLNVYNIKGEKVRTLLNNTLTAGEHHINWNGKNDDNQNVTSGIYFMHAESNNGDFTSVKKVLLLK